MKILNKILISLGILVVPFIVYGASVFNSQQLAPSPSNGNCLTTNGGNPGVNAWTSCSSGGSSATTTIFSNATSTGPNFTFATSSDTNLLLNITGSGSTVTFNPQWAGDLAISRGGTGITTAPSTNGQLLMASSTGWTVGNLVAGTNITITTSTPGQITIAASSSGGSGGGVSTTSPFTNGHVPYATSTLALTDSPILTNGIVSGINATSSIVNFNIQGTGALDPFNIASSNGTSLLDVKPNGRIGFNTITPADTYSFQLGSPISTTTTVLISDLGIDYNSSGIFAGTQPLLSVSKNNSAVGDNIACFGTGGQGQQVCFKDQAITKFQYGVQSGSIDVGGGIYTANQVGDIGIGNYIDWADAVSQQMVFKTFSTNNNFVWNNGVGGQILTLLYNGQLGINSSTPGTTLAVKAKATIDPFDVASSSGTSVLHVAQNGTTTISSLNVASWVCSTSSGQLYNGCSITSLGKVTTYNGLTTTGQGVSPIVAENEVDGTTTAATILTYTPTATTTLEAGGFLNVTAVVTDVLNYRLTWTDENGASQTQNFVAQGLTSASISTTGYIPFPSASAFRVAANTQVKLAIVFTTGIGSVTYDTEGYLRVIK